MPSITPRFDSRALVSKRWLWISLRINRVFTFGIQSSKKQIIGIIYLQEGSTILRGANPSSPARSGRWYVTQEPGGTSGILTSDSMGTWRWNQCRCNSRRQSESEGASGAEYTWQCSFFRFVPFPRVRRWDTCKLESKRMEEASGTPGWTVTFRLLDAWLSQKDPVLLGPNL